MTDRDIERVARQRTGLPGMPRCDGQTTLAAAPHTRTPRDGRSFTRQGHEPQVDLFHVPSRTETRRDRRSDRRQARQERADQRAHDARQDQDVKQRAAAELRQLLAVEARREQLAERREARDKQRSKAAKKRIKAAKKRIKAQRRRSRR